VFVIIAIVNVVIAGEDEGGHGTFFEDGRRGSVGVLLAVVDFGVLEIAEVDEEVGVGGEVSDVGWHEVFAFVVVVGTVGEEVEFGVGGFWCWWRGWWRCWAGGGWIGRRLFGCWVWSGVWRRLFGCGIWCCWLVCCWFWSCGLAAIRLVEIKPIIIRSIVVVGSNVRSIVRFIRGR